jgi:acetolactate synthase-1/2/3 large subunit
VVVVDNNYLGMVRQWQEMYYDRRYSAVELSHNPDFVKLASAYGIPGQAVDSEDGLRSALLAARDADGPYLVHVAVEKESNILPMVPPGGSLLDSTGRCIEKTGTFFNDDELQD